ncbi:hypothetical protein BC938DRAFT_476215 [Jimgerdemannia flammicorona]|uniref:CoA-transferase family III domain-containing protein n=1 Tax=Jimgerdemannia flammicorona TaxID=994334 RepID=A0A433QQQ8_9FUNG|nr:hypothetical protein BC938DRAFT_476215 [Jimgerdemannia flammicorona]
MNLSVRSTTLLARYCLSTRSFSIAPRSCRNDLSSVSSESGPLSGVRVLDLTRVLAGPYCTMLLGDLGAEVIKIENPQYGDDTRTWGPPWAENKVPTDKSQPESAYFLSVNRNKKSVAVNIKNPSGVALICDLARRSDVLVENYIPGKLDEMGLGYEELSRINPRLIYTSITGYGPQGPYAQRAGYDVMIEVGTVQRILTFSNHILAIVTEPSIIVRQAEAGLMHITGEKDGRPVKVGVAITGLYAHGAIMASLLHRHATNRGQKVDCSLFESQVASLVNIGSNYLIGGQEATRMGTSHPSIVPYQVMPSSNSHMMIGAGNDRQFRILCHRIGLEHLPEDARFKTNTDRVQHRDELIALLENRLKEHTTEHWLGVLEDAGIPFAPINNLEQTFKHPQVLARRMVQEVEHPKAGKIKLTGMRIALRPSCNLTHGCVTLTSQLELKIAAGIPVKYSAAKPSIRLPPPTLGQHTREVLSDILEYDDHKIDKLASEGAIRVG